MIKTLVLGLVCSLALLPRAGVAASPEEKQVQDQRNLQHAAWARQTYIHIIENGPPRARALAIGTIETAGLTSKPDQAIAEQAFAELLSDDDFNAQTLWVLVHLCQRPPYSDECDIEEVRERLVAAAPDNAAVYLIPDRQEEAGGAVRHVVPRARLLKAARATHYDTYWGRGAHLLYDLAMETVAQHPHPDEVEAGPPQWQAYWLASPLMVAHPQSFAPFHRSCEESVQSKDQELTDACYRLAQLMQDYNTMMIPRILGFALERTLMLREDPVSEAALNLWREQKIEWEVLRCLKSGNWPNPLTDRDLTAQDFRDMLQQFSELGELRWVEFRADQDYAREPDAWTRSPAECRALRELEGDALIAELGDQDPYKLWLVEGAKIRAAAADRP